MEPGRRSAARTFLKVSSTMFVPVYLLAVAVAYVTTGVPPGAPLSAWYAAVAPPLYATAASLWALGALEGLLSRRTLWALHVLAVPALVYSFLGLGLLLPLIAISWWVAAGKPPLFRDAPRQASARSN